MEAKSVAAIPVGAQWQYEPKWDGFRCLLRRDGNSVSMASKSGQDLARYFPEVVEAAMRLTEKHFLLDGELIIQCRDEPDGIVITHPLTVHEPMSASTIFQGPLMALTVRCPSPECEALVCQHAAE
jgi:hypothetical protein